MHQYTESQKFLGEWPADGVMVTAQELWLAKKAHVVSTLQTKIIRLENEISNLTSEIDALHRQDDREEHQRLCGHPFENW